MTPGAVQFSVASFTCLHSEFRPIEELYRVHKGTGIILGAIEYTLDGAKHMGELYNTDLIFMWEDIVGMCVRLMEGGEPVAERFEWGEMDLRYAGWERSHVDLRLNGRHEFYVPREQFLRVTLEGALHALRLIEKHFPRVAAQVGRAIREAERARSLIQA